MEEGLGRGERIEDGAEWSSQDQARSGGVTAREADRGSTARTWVVRLA